MGRPTGVAKVFQTLNRRSQLEVTNAQMGMHADGGGFRLQVTKTVSGKLNKSWLYRYAVGGREWQMGPGSLAEVKLADRRLPRADSSGRMELIRSKHARALGDCRGKRHNAPPWLRDLLCHEARGLLERLHGMVHTRAIGGQLAFFDTVMPATPSGKVELVSKTLAERAPRRAFPPIGLGRPSWPDRLRHRTEPLVMPQRNARQRRRAS